MYKVVIFVVTYNRLSTLQRTIESYKHFATNYEIVIVDNGTDNKECIDYLNQLPYKIHRNCRIYNLDELEASIAQAVSKYYETNSTPYYAVSDCDISFEDTPPDTLNVYMKLCDELNINVGPALRIDKISTNYPLRNKAIVDSLYDLTPGFQSSHHGIKYIHTGIDTTFCMFKATNTVFKRLSNTIRVFQPYWAHHLDWYIDIFNMLPDQQVYMNKTSPFGSSGGSYISGIHEDLQKGAAFAFEKRIKDWTGRELFSYYIEPYVISWMYQYGIGCEIDMQKSREWLLNMLKSYTGHRLNTIPAETYLNMIFNYDYSYLR